jgi:hypothetical protein
MGAFPNDSVYFAFNRSCLAQVTEADGQAPKERHFSLPAKRDFGNW